MTTILPAIIPESFGHLEIEVTKVKDFVNFVHVDITDGKFVKNKSWPYRNDTGEFEKLLEEEIGLPFWEDVDYEFHLMIESPEKSVEDWIKVGASSIVVHSEAMENLQESMTKISEMCKAGEVSLGLALKPSTDISHLTSLIPLIDFIHYMGSDDIGHHGATLDQSVFEKIETLRAMYPDMPIAIDIGVNEDTAPDFISLGATKLISGNAIFESQNIAETIKYFRSL